MSFKLGYALHREVVFFVHITTFQLWPGKRSEYINTQERRRGVRIRTCTPQRSDPAIISNCSLAPVLNCVFEEQENDKFSDNISIVMSECVPWYVLVFLGLMPRCIDKCI